MPLRTSRRALALFLSACAAVSLASAADAQVKLPPAPDSHLVAPPELAKFLPALEGWTKGDARLSEVNGAACSYTLVSASYAKGDVRVKLTLADTGAHAESIMALAAPIVSLPDDYDDKVSTATTIKRLKIDGSPAWEMWDAEKATGEITLLAGGRIVVTIEAQKGESLEALRAMLAAVDLKALTALK